MSSKAEYKRHNETYIRDKAKEPGYETLPGNVLYRIIGRGDGPVPGLSNVVLVYYRGYLTNGKIFDDNTDSPYPDAFRLRDLIPGWQTALTHMHVGDKWEIILPADQGYGKVSCDGIPANSTLIFEISLIGIG